MTDKQKKLFLDIFKNNKESFFKNFSEKDCNLVDKYEQSLLQEALSYSFSRDKYTIAKFLIENKCNLNHQDKKGLTALHYILSSRIDEKITLADILIDNMEDIDIEDNYGNTPLWYALKNPKIPMKIIEKLLKRGANPYHKNNVKKTPLDVVKRLNNPELNNIFKPYIKKAHEEAYEGSR